MLFNSVKLYGGKVKTINNKLDLHSYPWYLAGGIESTACIAAYQPKGATNLVTSYINLANPGTYDMSLGVAPTWSADTGWSFDGTSQWLNTKIVPNSTTSLIIRYTCLVDNNLSVAVNWSTGGITSEGYYGLSSSIGNKVWLQNQGYINSSNIGTSGILAIAGQYGYLNGIKDKDIPVLDGIIHNLELPIGAENNDFWDAENRIEFYANPFECQALSIYNRTLSQNEILALTNAMYEL